MAINNSRHLIWILYGALAGFGSSFVLGDLLTLPLDVYYLIYFGIVTGFFFLYIKKTKLDLKTWIFKRLAWGILLGIAFGILMVSNVLSRPATEQFTGAYLASAVLWRGLLYGAVDGLLLSTFPWIVTWRAFEVESKPFARKIIFGFVAWLFIVVMTTTYHVGYADFRSAKVIQANIGNTIMSAATLFSANPVGTPITHAMMHTAAVIHSPKTELFLPPHR